MLSLRRGRVTSVTERLPELVRLEVDGVACVAYPRLTGPVEEGDDVLVNVQARELGLGSGGFDVLYANLTRGLDLCPDEGAHVTKLPYTPLQVAVRHAEESRPLAETLAGPPLLRLSLPHPPPPVHAGRARGGSAVLAGRVSGGGERERHRGVSHHTRAALRLCLGGVTVAWPAELPAPGWLEPREEVDVTGWQDACAGLPLSHMGRGP